MTETFAKLRALLKKYEKKMKVDGDNDNAYLLNTPAIGANKKPIMFAAVRLGKAYVSYYLFPFYLYPELKEAISPALQKRMQGKTCFNFKTIDAAQLAELEKLTKLGFERMKQEGVVR